jgi:hypothetical protein
VYGPLLCVTPPLSCSVPSHACRPSHAARVTASYYIGPVPPLFPCFASIHPSETPLGPDGQMVIQELQRTSFSSFHAGSLCHMAFNLSSSRECIHSFNATNTADSGLSASQRPADLSRKARVVFDKIAAEVRHCVMCGKCRECDTDSAHRLLCSVLGLIQYYCIMSHMRSIIWYRTGHVCYMMSSSVCLCVACAHTSATKEVSPSVHTCTPVPQCLTPDLST